MDPAGDPPFAHFDRAKPFYPLVIQYLTFLVASKEIAAWGIARAAERAKLDADSGGQTPEELGLGEGTTDHLIRRMLATPPVEYLPPLNLLARIADDRVGVPIDLLADELFENYHYLFTFMPRFAGSLLILAWETTHEYHNHGPLWEFLRHCRNAAAHNGRFRFYKGEPKHPAEWRTVEVTRELEGTLLFDADEPGLLGPGDAVALLWHIEQTMPAATKSNLPQH